MCKYVGVCTYACVYVRVCVFGYVCLYVFEYMNLVYMCVRMCMREKERRGGGGGGRRRGEKGRRGILLGLLRIKGVKVKRSVVWMGYVR